MEWLDRAHAGLDSLVRAPGLRYIADRRYENVFARNRHRNLFRGVFATYEEAANSAPGSAPLGYDNEASASIEYSLKLRTGDYPAIFWLSRSLLEGKRRIMDLGGHWGVKYYAFATLLDYPADLDWTVCDVPAVARLGRELASSRDTGGRLHFIDSYDAIAEHDVLFATGSLQYLPLTLGELMSRFPALPARILVNFTPVHPTLSYFTLNSIGTAFCPYRVQDRERFVQHIRALGYELRDEWDNVGKGLRIPHVQGHDLDHYSGFCFERTGGFTSNGPAPEPRIS